MSSFHSIDSLESSGDVKENYNNHSSPIRKPKFDPFQQTSFMDSVPILDLQLSPIQQKMQEESAKEKAKEKTKQEKKKEALELALFKLTIPESHEDIVSKLMTNINYLKNLHIEEIDFKNISDTTDGIINYYHLVNKVNKHNQQVEMNNFKAKIIMNHCTQLLEKIGGVELNTLDDSISFDSSIV